MVEKKYSRGIFFMLLSATGLSLSVLFSKLALTSLSISSLIFYRFAASFLICLTLFAISKKHWPLFPIKNFKLHLLRAFFVLLTQYSIFYYLQFNSLLNATVLLNTGPLFIPIIEKVFGLHYVGKSTWVGIIISFIGVLFLIQPEEGIVAWSSLIGLMAGVGQAASQILFGLNTEEEKPGGGILVLFVLCTFVSFFPFLFFPAWQPIPKEMTLTLLIGYVIFLGFATTANQLFRGAAYQHGRPSNLSPFLYFSVLFAGVIDTLFFHKIPTIWTGLGAFLVICGGILKVTMRHYILKRKDK